MTRTVSSAVDVSPYVSRVEDVFKFRDGATVLVGMLESGSPRALAPCDVELIWTSTRSECLDLAPGADDELQRHVEPELR